MNIMAQKYEYDKYVTTKSGLKDMLDKCGVAIIPSVLNEQECTNMLHGMWNFLEHITKNWDYPINRSDKESYNTFNDLHKYDNMLIQSYSIGHTQFMWDLRQNEKIVDIYASLLDSTKDNLLVSYDGASFSIPPEIINTGWDDENRLHHTDQSYMRNNFECVQSWVTGLDVNDGDATLSFLEMSHKYHYDFAKYFKIDDEFDYFQLDKIHETFYVKKGCEYKKIKCPKGSMVFWDSRTIHRGANALQNRKNQNFRCVGYVCYDRKNLCTVDNLNLKHNAFKNLYTTSHNPIRPTIFDTYPIKRSLNELNITPIDKPILTELGFKLAGF